MNFKIREIKSTDKPQILKLFNEFGDYFVKIDNLKLEIKASNYADFFYNSMIKDIDGKGKVFVAEHDQELIGFAAGNYKDIDLSVTPDVTPHRKGRILELFVKEKYRGHGVGSSLFHEIENYLASMNCHVINIEVFAPNKIARNFYEKYGYQERNVDLIKVIRKPNNPRNTLKKVINIVRTLFS